MVRVITLCGSTRFTKEMLIKQWELTKKGIVVLSWCALPDDYLNGNTHVGDHEGVKERVDWVHKRKIDISDEILVLNIGGYIGESTRSEIEYAKANGKTVNFLEPLADPTKFMGNKMSTGPFERKYLELRVEDNVIAEGVQLNGQVLIWTINEPYQISIFEDLDQVKEAFADVQVIFKKSSSWNGKGGDIMAGFKHKHQWMKVGQKQDPTTGKMMTVKRCKTCKKEKLVEG